MRSRTWIAMMLAIALAHTTAQNAAPALADETAPSGGSAAPSLWVTPLVLDFGPVGVGYTSAPLVVTVSNTGSDTLTNFAGGAVGPTFSAGQNCAGSVPPGGSCQYSFTFSPPRVGMFTATSNSSTNAGPIAIELHGEGVRAGLHVNPISLDFGSVRVGTTSDQQAVSIRNTGLATLTDFGGGAPVDPQFNASHNCAGGVPPGWSCQYLFSFSPTAAGTFTTTSNTSTNAGNFSIDLQGQGRTSFFSSGQRVTPRSLDFGPVGIGLTSGLLAAEVTNQNGFSSITGFAGGGVYPPFGASQNCVPSLPPGDTCQFFYTFEPTETGVFTTTSKVSNSAGSFTIELRGEAVGAGLSVSPLSLHFGPVPVGDSGTAQGVTIKNTGMSTLTGFAGGGVYPPFSASQDCVGGVAPGGTCQFTYNFSPTETGPFSTTSRVGTDAGSFSILLMGGVDVPAMGQAFLPDQIPPGATTTVQYTISNPNTSATLFDVGFSNTFPTGLVVDAPLVFTVSPECGSPTFSPTVGAASITFANATVLGGDDCVVNLNVTAADIGVYSNTTDPVTSASGSGNAAGATLTVGAKLYLPMVLR